MTKLNHKKIRWIVRHCAESNDFSTGEAAEIYHVSQRRVQQILKEYRETGEIPVLNQNRRPKTHLKEEQERMIEEVWKETRVGSMSKVTPLRTRLSLESRRATILRVAKKRIFHTSEQDSQILQGNRKNHTQPKETEEKKEMQIRKKTLRISHPWRLAQNNRESSIRNSVDG